MNENIHAHIAKKFSALQTVGKGNRLLTSEFTHGDLRNNKSTQSKSWSLGLS